ncbi:MAG: tetratricopeptide repeat protein [Bacteroidota bacterium]
MAKNIPHKKYNYSLQFLFPETESSKLRPGYLSEFASKISTEFVARANICFMGLTEPSAPDQHQLIQYVTERSGAMQDVIRDGYVMVFESGSLELQVNPNEFFRLDLPEPATDKVYYEVSFKGKKGVRQGGLILPSDAVKYVMAIKDQRAAVHPGMIRIILNKVGFVGEAVTIHQEMPVGTTPKKSSVLLQKLRLTLAWNTIIPVREARNPFLKNLFFTDEHPLLRLAFFGFALAIFLIIPILSLDAGLSGDDEKHYNHAIKVYNYFSEGDSSALDDPQFKLNYYGQSFDFFTYLMIKLFNLEDTPFEARHVMVAISGAAAILFTGLLVKLFSGYSGGLLAMVLMFLSPRFLGHSFNNPMDIPFTLGNIFTLYYITLFLKKLPKFSMMNAIWIAVGIGWTNGIRIGGLLLIPYLFMFAGFYLLLHKWPWKFFSLKWWRFSLHGLGILVLISAAGYLISILTWPYALQDIINHPIQAFKMMTNIQVSIRVLYDGLVQWSDHLPWHYIPKNIWLTVPVLILLGWFASVITWITDRKEGNGFWYFMLWFTVLFPVIFIIYRKSNVYGGWRHMMFIYPSMVALSAMAISSLVKRTGKPWARYLAIALIIAGLFHPLKHVIRNHPNTYIYFNEWAGGINNAFGKMETDYYSNSLGPATDYFIESILPGLEASKEEPVRVASNFTINYYFRNHLDQVQPFYARYYDLGKYDWDYAILYCNYIHPFQLNNGFWPPKNTIHEIRVDDVVVAAIVERKNKDDYHGSTLLSEGMNEQDGAKLEQALLYLESAVEYNPNNEVALLELGNVYSAFLMFNEARNTMDQLLQIYPDYDKALNAKGYSYLIQAEYTQDFSYIDDAIRIINLAIKSNYKFYSGYYNLGLCYGLKGDRPNAEHNFKQAINYNSKFKAAYVKLAELYDAYGDFESAQLVREQLNRLK